MNTTILIFAEHRDSNLLGPSLEALSEGQRLAEQNNWKPIALLVGDQESSELKKQCSQFVNGTVVTAINNQLSQYSVDLFAETISSAIESLDPEIVLFAATSRGKDLAPRVAANLKTGLVSNCVDCLVDNNGDFLVKKIMYSGKIMTTIRFNGNGPKLVTLKPNVFPIADSIQESEIEETTFPVKTNKAKAIVTKISNAETILPEVSEANIVISGGRGVNGPEQFKLLNELAQTLNAAVGASRAAVDANWIDHTHQIGQTGKSIAPSVYLACGISGTPQHLAGISESKKIIAINENPSAPIFKHADYCLIGDLHIIVPKITEELKKRKG